VTEASLHGMFRDVETYQLYLGALHRREIMMGIEATPFSITSRACFCAYSKPPPPLKL
jgi:hypothetical protein